MSDSPRRRAERFAGAYGLRAPVVMAPMAGACPVPLAAAVAEAGGMGACGALLMEPLAIAHWAASFRSVSEGPFQMNLWVPDPTPLRDPEHEAAVQAFLAGWEPQAAELDATLPVDFDAQCEALIEARPAVASSIMGLFPPSVVERLKARGTRWFAVATTVTEAVAAAEAGADAIVAQGMEAGGHRGAFDAARAEERQVGLFSLLPAVADAVRVPVIATGGIADARGAAAALVLGASAVQIGTALLRSPEAGIAPAWADAIGAARPEDTASTRAFSGRLGRSLVTDYIVAARRDDAPRPLPYPLQRSATGPMRAGGARVDDLARLQAWAGQSAALARPVTAGETVGALWDGATALLRD